MRISFDWDSCLSEERQQKIAAKFIAEGHEVWIVTSRREHPVKASWDNKPVYAVAERLGILPSRILFTEGHDKWHFLELMDMHFDDDVVEIEGIEQNLPNCTPVLIYDP